MDTNFFRKYNVLEYKPGDLSLIKKYPFGLNVRVLLYKKGDGEINPFRDLKFEKIRDGNPNYDLLSDYKVLERKKVSINPFEKVKFVEWIKPDGEVVIKDGKIVKQDYFQKLEKRELEKEKGITIDVFLQKDISDYIKMFEKKSEIVNYLLFLSLRKFGVNLSFNFNREEKVLRDLKFENKENANKKKVRHHIALNKSIAKYIFLIQKEFLENGKNKTISEIVNYLLLSELGKGKEKELKEYLEKEKQISV